MNSSSQKNKPLGLSSQIASDPNPRRILRHWKVLCETIGDRRAGGAGERAAADYLETQFIRLGLANVRSESFPCVSVVKAEADVRVRCAGRFEQVPARPLAGSPPTPDKQVVEGELVWVEMPEQADRLFTSQLHGKIVVLVGPMPTQANLHHRLVECQPAAVLHIDDRLPFEWVKDDGVYPVWVERYGMPPIAAVPFRVGWNLRKRGATRARVRLMVERQAGLSQNVVAEILGRDPSLPVVLLGAHHDTQCHNPGADDNASGVVALLEIANLLAATQPLRTIRFVSFGTEEQLSVGSAVYVRRHYEQMQRIGVVLNLDSVSSPLGHHWMIRAGSLQFSRWMTSAFATHGLDVADKPAPMPFADHFPFSIFGVPAVTLYRPNMDSGMRWQHHSDQDDLSNVSVPELCRVISATKRVVQDLSSHARLPFSRGLALEHRAESYRIGRELFDLSPILRLKKKAF